MTVRRLHVPLRSAEEIIPHLGAPHHWREGRSAKSLIDQWWLSNAIPPTVRALLEQAPEWQGAELVDAFAERCTNLDDGRPSHSQSDLLAIVGVGAALGVIAIEAKVDEGFDKTVVEWLGTGGAGKRTRLSKLCAMFSVEPERVDSLRYQLFHRTASAVIEARRYRARQAAMIVQSWCPIGSGFADFSAFFEAIGVRGLRPGAISEAIVIDDVALRVAWSAEVKDPARN